MTEFVATNVLKARRVAKRLRKRARRVKSGVQAGRLWLRNVVSRQPVTGQVPVTVSLTSYGPRLRSVALAIESMAAGTSRPARLTLWLDNDVELPNGKMPKSLLRLQRRGLEICTTPNVGPHGKYYGYVTSLPSHTVPLVTADDDIMYPRRWLASLYEAHLRHPLDVHCHWAKHMTTTDGKIDPYHEWPVATDTAARQGNFALGVSGVIYPPNMLNELALRGSEFTKTCPKADDIWLHWTAMQAGISVRQTGNIAHHFPLIPGTQGESLLHSNVANGGNDLCIHNLYKEGDVITLNQISTVRTA